MAVKERSQIKGTDAQIKAFAGHNGVLAFATDTKSLHVLSGTAGTTTEFLPSTKVATKAELGSYATSETLTTELAKKANTADVTESFAEYTKTANLSAVAISGSYEDLAGKPQTYDVGDIKLYAGSNVPNGWFRCDGSTIADMATNYPKLYAVLGTNVLPNYSGRTLYGASSDINATIGSGLPNIQGKLLVTAGNEQGTYAGFPTRANGCFVSENWDESDITAYFVASGTPKIRTDTHTTATWFNAARSNSTYGASTTVQPPAVKVAVLIKHD